MARTHTIHQRSIQEQLSVVNRMFEFASRHNLVMRVRGVGGSKSYSASFEGVEVKEGKFLRSFSCLSDTPAEAIVDYAVQISGTTLVHRAMSEDRREFSCPFIAFENPLSQGA